MVPVDVVFTRGAHHRRGCVYTKRAKTPGKGPLWLSFFEVIPPCRHCFNAAEFTVWLHALMSYHRNCRPRMPYAVTRDKRSRRRLGRPRSLSSADLQRVLSLYRGGLGTRAIAGEMRKAGVDVSRPTVQRALAKRGVYAHKIQRVAKPR